ncbi:ThiF family adenylyltransferase [Burkholderia sp. SCN-KJ]|uniref:ThiF family adenylyltransferase n=1 Tax=Burkholderia sp. SCN-KJ TaxID=2969248 RepID=UPI00214FC18F|nr:ThiF family adenylyltransferase [Burkholderia sp. SCN-KJ]MCR4470398.1 ThiF family adenylyltransferase [Burkholderia sp. SCN-KJ]
MGTAFADFGTLLPGVNAGQLQTEAARRLLDTCKKTASFDVVALRAFELNQNGTNMRVAEAIEVDCCDGTVPSRNPVGINPRERLLLIYRPGEGIPYDVRALRADFPRTLHQNHVGIDEPRSLCLYFEPWNTVERAWTPERHLARITWWLRETSLGTLHRNDQPLERMYFVTPWQLVLPPDFHARSLSSGEVLSLHAVESGAGSAEVFVGQFAPRQSVGQAGKTVADVLPIAIAPIVHHAISDYPHTLGEFEDQLVERGSSLIGELNRMIEVGTPSEGLELKPGGLGTVIVVRMPVVAAADVEPARVDLQGFLVKASIAQLGIACGVLIDGKDGRAYIDSMARLAPVVDGAEVVKDGWRAFAVEPLDVRIAPTKADARAISGVKNEGAEFDGLIAGVGALGSAMADMWSRAGWGKWTVVDDDVLKAHNVARHQARYDQVGRSKAIAVAELMQRNFFPGVDVTTGIHAKVADAAPAVKEAIKSAALLVDATTSFNAPRDLSSSDEVPRSASTFLTPSGFGSVLLLEDDQRSVRLSSLEPQYYRAVLESDWGAQHLAGHYGQLWVGGGCRDISAVISAELINLHAATLARQLRLSAGFPEARMSVWTLDDSTSSLLATDIPVARPLFGESGGWRVVWDDELLAKLRTMRGRRLPNETGGVLLGYWDLPLNTCFLVDALPAPLDSVEERTGFIRGTAGLQEALDECRRRTARIVDYVGEWHSHPDFVSSRPSTEDYALLDHMATVMANDGLPSVMLIVGDSDVTILTGLEKS